MASAVRPGIDISQKNTDKDSLSTKILLGSAPAELVIGFRLQPTGLLCSSGLKALFMRWTAREHGRYQGSISPGKVENVSKWGLCEWLWIRKGAM